MNSSIKIPVKNMDGKFKQAARLMLSVFEALMQSMRKTGRTEGSRRKGADHSANRKHICPCGHCTSGSSTEIFISLSIREVSFPVKENVAQKSRFAHLQIASKPQTCKERFYRKILH